MAYSGKTTIFVVESKEGRWWFTNKARAQVFANDRPSSATIVTHELRLSMVGIVSLLNRVATTPPVPDPPHP